jgi:hypothetical protein
MKTASNRPSICRATHEQPPVLSRLREGNEDIVAQVDHTRLNLR